MRVETNVRVIKRNRKIAQYSFFVSMGIWILGLVVSFTDFFENQLASEMAWIEIAISLVLPFALGLALFAVYMTNLWIREPRPEQAIRDGLKGISNKSVLYHYYHNPAKHVLIAPQGIFVIVVRWQQGDIQVEEDKWRQQRGLFARFFGLFRLDNLGDPVGEAERAANYLKRVLEPIAPEIDVEAVVVLTDPRADAEVTDSPIPVLYTDEKRKPNLKDFMRNHPNKGSDVPLTKEQLGAFEEATLPAGEA